MSDLDDSPARKPSVKRPNRMFEQRTHESTPAGSLNGHKRHTNPTSTPRTLITTVRCGPNEYRVGLYGWRRRCLYGLVLFLLVVVVVNLALTLFILRVLDFSTTGMGSLQIVNDGVVANGDVHVMGTLMASRITSRPHEPIQIHAAHNITLGAVDAKGNLKNSIFMDEKALVCTGNKFLVRDADGQEVFSVSKEEVLVGAKHLSVSGEGGTSLSGSLQTSRVTAPVSKSLLLESATRNLEVRAPQGIALESRAGTITTNCLDDLILQSRAGMIKFDSPDIFLRGLPTSTIQTSNPATDRPIVYQVCVCSGGRLFLANPTGVCAADHEFCK